MTNSSNQVRPFAVYGGMYYQYATPVDEYGSAAAGVTYTALDLSSSVPRFCTRARLRLVCATANTSFFFDTSSTAVTPNAYTTSVANGGIMIDVPTNSSQNTYWYASGANVVDLDCVGYFIDEL